MSSPTNQWIALTAELEDTREAIAKAIFKHYRAGKVHNEYCIDQCRRLDELYKDAKKYEQELAEDFRGCIDTGTSEKQTVAHKAQAKAANFLTKMYIKRNVTAYKRNFKEQFMELGQRAITSMDDGVVICDDANVVRLCRYAAKVRKDADQRWEEIQILHRENVRGNAFLGAIQQFIVNLTLWGRKSGLPVLTSIFKIDQGVTDRLRDEYRKKFKGSAPKDLKDS